MDFAGKTFWITGEASGMGRSRSPELAIYGVRLIIFDRDAAGLDQTTTGAEAKYCKAGSKLHAMIYIPLNYKWVFHSTRKNDLLTSLCRVSS